MIFEVRDIVVDVDGLIFSSERISRLLHVAQMILLKDYCYPTHPFTTLQLQYRTTFLKYIKFVRL